MKGFLTKLALAGALIMGSLGATATPSAAQEWRGATVELVQDRRGDRGRHWDRRHDRGRHWHRGHHRDRWDRPRGYYGDRYRYRPPAVVFDYRPPVVVRPQYVRPRYVAPARLSSAHIQWCYDRYRSYRASDNTFQPYHGPRRQCYSPY